MKKLITIFLALVCSAALAQDLNSMLKVQTVIRPHNNKTDVTSDPIDNYNYQRDLIHINVTATEFTATDSLRIKLEESLDNGSYTPVLDYNILGNNTPVDASGTCYLFDKELVATYTDVQFMYTGRCPFLKVKCDYSGNIATAPTVLVNIVKGGRVFGF